MSKTDAILNYPYPDYSWPLAIGISWRRESALDQAIELFTKCRVKYAHALEFGLELALAYLERGNPGDDLLAEQTLQNMEAEYGPPDEEFLCRYGRLYKDRGDNRLKARNREEAAALYEEACEWYGKAFNERQGHYPGINRATLLLIRASLAGSETEKTRLATESAELADNLLKRYPNWPRDYNDDDIWHSATAAEAHFLKREWPEAHRRYLEALQRKCQDFHRNSMSKQAKRIQAAFSELGETSFGPLQDLDALFRV